MAIRVGSSPLTVNALGRMVASGSTGSHSLKIVNAASGLDVPGGVVSLVTANAVAGGFAYASLPAPVVLSANASYYVVSQETAGGDRWYDYNTLVATQSFASVTGAVYGSGSAPYTPEGGAWQAYGPLDLLCAAPGSNTSSGVGTAFVTATSLGTLRHDYSGWVGMTILVGPSPITIKALGRYAAAGNNGTHTVKIVQAASGADLAGGSVSVNLAAAASGSYVYSSVPVPVTLQPNTLYLLLSQETVGGDQWYDYNTVVQTTNAATWYRRHMGTGIPT